MSLPITEAMQQAQDAISGGNYRAAVTTCSQLVKQFPAYAAAQRLLGEAYLEQGQSDAAERAFAAALAGNPRQPFAYLGLGLLAEDRGATDTALAYCQVAWELAPQLVQLREPVARISARRYGADGQLQLTRAALAQLHVNASRLRRAASEYRAALAALPDRVDLKLGLAETLWRLDEHDEAADLTAQVLEQQPDAVQALIIQTDIEQRAGNAQRAEVLRARLRAVDPDGDATAALLVGHAQADRGFLLVPDDAIPALSEQVDSVMAERPHIAPAPDFTYVPSRSDTPPPDLDDLQPLSIEEFGATAGETAAREAAMGAGDIPADHAEAGDIGALGFEDFSETPFDPNETLPSFSPTADAAPTGDIVMDDDLSALAAALEGDVAEAVSRTDAPSLSREVEPFDFAMFDQPSTPPAPLAAELDAFEHDVPPSETPRGYTTVLQELDSAGLAPFDALNHAAPAADMAADATEAPAVPQPPQPQAGELASLASRWDDIDAEIQNAVPWEQERGFTDQLRSLEEIGLEPFKFEDEDSGAPAAPAMAAPDAVAMPESAAARELEASATGAAAEPGILEDDALLSGLEPFTFQDVEAATLSSSQPNWDASSSKSAVPSDADLEALLAVEDEPFLDDEPALAAQAEPSPEAELESLDAAAPAVAEPAITPEPETIPEPDEFEQFIHSTLAATRALPPDMSQPSDGQPAFDIPEAEQPDSMDTADRLFERTRATKDQLVAEGVISGDREFEDAATPAQAQEDIVVEPDAGLSSAAQSLTDTAAEPDDAEEHESAALGASRDTATLRAALTADPHDAELHWWLAESLRASGDLADAYVEYRWVIRNAPERHDAVLRALHECVERGQQPEMAHRLLADVYRRHGDVSRASNHAAQALQQHQHQHQHQRGTRR